MIDQQDSDLNLPVCSVERVDQIQINQIHAEEKTLVVLSPLADVCFCKLSGDTTNTSTPCLNTTTQITPGRTQSSVCCTGAGSSWGAEVRGDSKQSFTDFLKHDDVIPSQQLQDALNTF